MIDILNKSWAEKYRPKTINDLILPNDNWKKIIESWVTDKRIGGNVALFGFGGLGKSSLARIIVNEIITNQADFKIFKSRSVQEVDTLGEFIRSKPISSPIKIILIEEADRLSPAAQTELKEKYTEQYQDHCAIIITSNYPNAIDEFLLQRFLYKIDFSHLDQGAIFRRLLNILQQEECQVNENDLKEWISQNSQFGMRELINKLQLSSNLNNKLIVFDDITSTKDLEDKTINLITTVIGNYLSCRDPKERKLAFVNPVNSKLIGPPWVEFTQLVTNNSKIDFRHIFEVIETKIHFLPLKQVIVEYLDKLQFKKYPHLHLISCLCDMMKCINDIN